MFNFGSKPQNIDENPASWNTSTITLDTVDLSYKLPQNGYTIVSAPDGLVLEGSKEKDIILSETGYDRNDGLSQFFVRFTISKHDKPVDSANWTLFRSFSVEQLDAISASPTTHIDHNSTERKWLRSIPENGINELFTTPIDDNYSLTVTGYYRDKITKKKDWLNRRKQLLEKIIDTVKFTKTQSDLVLR